MRTICTIGPVIVTEHGDDSVSYIAGAQIDGDGSGPSHNDPCFQNDTSLHHPLTGKALNADDVPFVVVPPAVIHGVKGVVLGCKAHVTNTKNGRQADCVVADIGPHSKIGELSIAAAKALGVNPSPTVGGESGRWFLYTLWPGVAANVGGVQYRLTASAA